MNLTVPRFVVNILFLLCIILNAISIALCLSALFLLILAYLDLGHLLGASFNGRANIFPATTTTTTVPTTTTTMMFSNEIENMTQTTHPPDSSSATPTTTTPTTIASVVTTEPPLLPESRPDQLNLIFYLMFYLAVAILGLMGAARRYHVRKINYLVCHVLLLCSIICFNLLAWFHFRTYSPLHTASSSQSYTSSSSSSSSLSSSSSSSLLAEDEDEEEPNLLLASLFDFVDFLIGLSLLVSLILNRKHLVRMKQRNSITPIIAHSPNGSAASNQSYTIA